MKTNSMIIHLSIFTSFLCFISCEEPSMPPDPVYPDGSIIGPQGPEPMRGWDAISVPGRLDFGNYYKTGGSWYASVEIDTLIYTEFTQLYLNRDIEELGNGGWYLERNFTVSERFLYIPDPLRAYFSWNYVVIIYLDYYVQ